ncbi:MULTISPECIES: DUF4982 domain-containing protein [Streptomyces]|uniref:DUF4982 domain-containing protein n=2 Tax=Streptomyces TaxID=1883 RepID=A0ABV9J1D3_9ACTN
MQTQAIVNQIIWRQRTRPYLAVQPVNRSGERQAKTGWRRTNSVASWSWEGCEGLRATVEIWADAPRVELVLNGRTVGSKRADESTQFLAEFRVPYEPGSLVAIAFDQAGKEIGRDVLTSASSTSLRLMMRPETDELRADGADLLYVPIELADERGTIRPLADREVTLTVTGAGSLLGFGTGEAIATEEFAANRHRTFQGRALAVVRAGHETGHVSIAASADGCESVSIAVPVVPLFA